MPDLSDLRFLLYFFRSFYIVAQSKVKQHTAGTTTSSTKSGQGLDSFSTAFVPVGSREDYCMILVMQVLCWLKKSVANEPNPMVYIRLDQRCH